MNNLFKESDTTILLVDDEQICLDIMEDILKDEGYRIITSRSGKECCHRVRENIPDLILLDINMPDIDGIETCNTLKKDAETSEIPVILMTASNEDSVIENAFESGCTDYLNKPVRRMELLTRLRSALNNKRLKENLVEEEKFKGMMELAGAICHELHQPLHAIMGYADLLEMGSDEDSNVSRNAKIISEQAERMGKITQQLMGLVKIQTKPYIGNTNIVDLDKSSHDEGIQQERKR